MKNLIKLFPFLFAICFITGFLIWNIYLNSLGFSEYDIIQTRFILTGAIFVLIAFDIYILFGSKVIREYNKLKESKWRKFFVTIIIFGIILFFLFYIFVIFPFIPSYLGGGHPKFLSLVGDENIINYLTAFGIERGRDSKIQTANYCIAYEDKDSIIILLKDRVLNFRKEIFKGFSSLPGEEPARSFGCSIMSLLWQIRGSYSY